MHFDKGSNYLGYSLLAEDSSHFWGKGGGAWLGLAITYKYDLPVVCLILFGRRQARPSQVAELYLYGNC